MVVEAWLINIAEILCCNLMNRSLFHSTPHPPDSPPMMTIMSRIKKGRGAWGTGGEGADLQIVENCERPNGRLAKGLANRPINGHSRYRRRRRRRCLVIIIAGNCLRHVVIITTIVIIGCEVGSQRMGLDDFSVHNTRKG